LKGNFYLSLQDAEKSAAVAANTQSDNCMDCPKDGIFRRDHWIWQQDCQIPDQYQQPLAVQLFLITAKGCEIVHNS